MTNDQVGKQTQGSSDGFIYEMAMKALQTLPLDHATMTAIDVGSGRGNFSKILSAHFQKVIMLDAFKPDDIPANAVCIPSDLNNNWEVESNSIDFVFSLEVIEHLENPRHFFREIKRILKPGGYAFVSTPHNHSLTSLITFVFKGQHRSFQSASYPAHITPVLKIDMDRMLMENGFKTISYFYSDYDTVPGLGKGFRFKGKLFSKNFAVLFSKEK
jgi:2-polyprenyl-3-methyl-5-hydroxy-6-metoxy-1,4-benzoquinol methylase